MVVMYNPRDTEYTDEMSVRHEISRVFDACFSCQKCVETCGVFPSLVSAVKGCQRNDASLLTPEQQDNILEGCHMCMQCVVQCPFSQTTNETVTSSDVRFPELVIRHRTMLWSHGFVSLKQRLLSYLFSSWPYVVHRFSLGRRLSIVRRLVRSTMSNYVELLFENGVHLARWRPIKRCEQSPSENIVVFPTCVVDEFQPQLVDDFVAVGRELHFGCRGLSSLVCCGASSLYVGDLKSFRRTAKRNVSRLSRYVRNGSKIVVGQPSCLSVMKQFYPVVAPHPATSRVVDSMCDMTQFLVDKIPDMGMTSVASNDAARYVILQSSTQQFTNALYTDQVESTDELNVHEGLQSVLQHSGEQVSEMTYPSFAETVWSCQNRFRNDIATRVEALDQRLSDLDRQGDSAVVFADSCLVALHFADRPDRDIVHPVSWITQQLRGSVESRADADEPRQGV